MNGSVITQLVKKDFDLNKRFIPAVVVAGLVSLAVLGLPGPGPIVGVVLLITTLVAFGILIGIYSVLMERDKQIHLFMLSLPITPQQYIQSKLISSLLCFLMPWSLVTAAAAAGILLVESSPNGNLPFMMLLMLYLLCNFCIFLAVAMVSTSERLIVATIILTNMSITLFITTMESLPTIAQYRSTEFVVWGGDTISLSVAVLLVSVLAPTMALIRIARRKDFY